MTALLFLSCSAGPQQLSKQAKAKDWFVAGVTLHHQVEHVLRF